MKNDDNDNHELIQLTVSSIIIALLICAFFHYFLT
jgi:hypothetical protein